jgi:protein-S-isoprenylcysteine O-methyltransferase Ste14
VTGGWLQVPPLRLPEIAFLAVGAAAAAAVTWRSLRNRQSHALPRCVAFLAILLLLAWNLRRWFADPLSPLQLASWFLLGCSLLLVVPGFRLLRRVGTPRDAFESTTELVTTGIYRHIRHPLYGSLLFLAWGTLLKRPTLAGAIAALVASAAVTATARLEERENVRRFGEAYVEYRRTSSMFVPYLF